MLATSLISKSTLDTEPSLSRATPSNTVSSETGSLWPSYGAMTLMNGALFELSMVRVSSTGSHSSTKPSQKSESEAHTVNV